MIDALMICILRFFDFVILASSLADLRTRIGYHFSVFKYQLSLNAGLDLTGLVIYCFL